MVRQDSPSQLEINAMTEINITQYLLAIIGFLLVYTLNGIKTELKDVKHALESLERDLHGRVTALTERVVKVETRCSLHHGEDE